MLFQYFFSKYAVNNVGDKLHSRPYLFSIFAFSHPLLPFPISTAFSFKHNSQTIILSLRQISTSYKILKEIRSVIENSLINTSIWRKCATAYFLCTFFSVPRQSIVSERTLCTTRFFGAFVSAESVASGNGIDRICLASKIPSRCMQAVCLIDGCGFYRIIIRCTRNEIWLRRISRRLYQRARDTAATKPRVFVHARLHNWVFSPKFVVLNHFFTLHHHPAWPTSNGYFLFFFLLIVRLR